MKKIKLTLDNCFRNPFRWGRCPVGLNKILVWGIYISWGEKVPTMLKNRWVLCIYYGARYRAWSNYPEDYKY